MNSSSSADSSYQQQIPISLQTSSNNESSDSSSSSSSSSDRSKNQSQETDEQQSAKKTTLNDEFSESHLRDYKNIVCSLASESFSNSLQNCLIASLAFSLENTHDDASERDARESEQEGYEEDGEENGAVKTSIKKRRQDQRVRKRKRPHLNDSLHLGVWPIQDNGSKLHSFASIVKDCKYHGERERMADLKVAETTCKQLLLELRPKGRNRFFNTASTTNKNDGDDDNVGNAQPIRTRNLGCVSVQDLWEAADRVGLSAAAIQNAKNRFHLLQFRNLLEQPSE